jgi:hypothetical protein
MRVAVLGGGLQGACVALELASAGVAVDLYDKNDHCLTQASAQNEGKIHLGYIYANDRTRNTARTMIRGGLSFAPLLRRWVGDGIDRVPVSSPFHYVVHDDSFLSPEEVADHLDHCHAMALEEGRGGEPDYFGSDYRQRPVRLSESESSALFDRRRVKAAFRTAEIGIDPEALSALVRARLLADPKIRRLQKSQVLGVTLSDRGVEVEFARSGERDRARYDHAVNTLWDGRLAVDRTAGLAPERPWLYRIKHYLRIQAPELAPAVPSTSIVLGPFGDVVAYGNGALYLSWYPAGLRGMSSELSPPDWPLTLDEPAALEVRRGIQAGLARIVPAVDALTPGAVKTCEVKAGIIFAWGQTDIDDRASGLHERHAIGVRSKGRYHSVDTGKLTMAPLFGKMVADRIRQMG